MYYVICAVIGVFVGVFITNVDFKLFIMNASNQAKPFRISGKNYFFMTQDRIQNACKAIIKSFPEDFKDEIENR